MNLRLYRRKSDGALSEFSIFPGNDWEVVEDVTAEMLEQVRADLEAADHEPEWQGTRYEYRVVNIGTFGTEARLREALNDLGARGWRFVHALDKSSNWLAGGEKVFLVFMRESPGATALPPPLIATSP